MNYCLLHHSLLTMATLKITLLRNMRLNASHLSSVSVCMEDAERWPDWYIMKLPRYNFQPLRQSSLPGAKNSVRSPVVILCALVSSLSILCLYTSLFSTRSFTKIQPSLHYFQTSN